MEYTGFLVLLSLPEYIGTPPHQNTTANTRRTGVTLGGTAFPGLLAGREEVGQLVAKLLPQPQTPLSTTLTSG